MLLGAKGAVVWKSLGLREKILWMQIKNIKYKPSNNIVIISTQLKWYNYFRCIMIIIFHCWSFHSEKHFLARVLHADSLISNHVIDLYRHSYFFLILFCAEPWCQIYGSYIHWTCQVWCLGLLWWIQSTWTTCALSCLNADPSHTRCNQEQS